MLVGLANHAGPDGTAAFPSVRTLMRYTGLAERTVRACLSRLEAAGVISLCDPAIIAARIRRADRRPRGWDLNLARIRGDLTQAEIALLERQFPGLAARIAAIQADDQADGPETPEGGVHAPHPAEPVDNPAGGVQEMHPVPGTGCSRRPDGVQPAQPRGAPHAPEPYKEPNPEPPAAARLLPVIQDERGGVADGGRMRDRNGPARVPGGAIGVHGVGGMFSLVI